MPLASRPALGLYPSRGLYPCGGLATVTNLTKQAVELVTDVSLGTDGAIYGIASPGLPGGSLVLQPGASATVAATATANMTQVEILEVQDQ